MASRVCRVAVAALLVVLCAAFAARGATYPEPVEGDFVIRGFRFATGETLPELKLHYRTLGRPERDAQSVVRNGVLVLHGTGGSGRGFLSEGFAGRLFGPGQLLDAARYFIVLPDGIGHGGSSKPSDGLRQRFPRYTYDDMVAAQHRLLTEGLQVNHLFLVIGTSMGGMHTWLWGEKYPGFMDGLVPLASVPTQIAGRNRVMRRMIHDAIRGDPAWRNGEYQAQPRHGLTGAIHILMMMTSSPLQWHKAAPTRDQADAFLAEQVQRRLASTDANDMLYHFDASRDYDPSKDLETIRAPVLAINSADDLVNPPELGLMERLMPRVKRGRYVLIPTSDETRGHGTHSLPSVWGSHLEAFLKELRAAGPAVEEHVATFSILGFDPATEEVGGAVQSRVFSVGNGVLWAEAGVGAVATQAIVDVSYGPQALALLRKGKKPAEIVKRVWGKDPDPRPQDWSKQGRQLAVMNAKGDYAAFTGPKATAWAGHKGGRFCTAQGNILAGEAVVNGMIEAFERTEGHLSFRLLAALEAAQAAGGDTRGMQSAAMLIVKRDGGVWLHNDVVLRLHADDSPEPIKELRRLVEKAAEQRARRRR